LTAISGVAAASSPSIAGYGRRVRGRSALDHVELTTIFDLAAVVALVLAGTSFVVARRRPSPAALHPQLGAGSSDSRKEKHMTAAAAVKKPFARPSRHGSIA
jgi:hypothetical protein